MNASENANRNLAHGRGEKERPKPPPKSAVKETPRDTSPDLPPDKVLAAGWKRVRRGLFWIQFALLWLLLLGFVGIGKTLYEKQVGELPKGDGKEWISIEGFVNSEDKMAVPLSKEQIIDLAAYGIPILFAGILLMFGRLVAGGGPRFSGSRGLFGLSALFTLLAFVALIASVMFSDIYKTETRAVREAFQLVFPLAEFWCVLAITACGMR